MKWQPTLKMYQDYLRIERGLSENTISNYSLDIIKLMKWLDTHEMDISPIDISEKKRFRNLFMILQKKWPPVHKAESFLVLRD